MEKRELRVGDRAIIILDPLSHGSCMSNLRVSTEILDVQCSPQSGGDPEVEFDLEVAAYRVITQDEVDDNGVGVDLGNWPPMVGDVHTVISINNGPWMHTAWPTVVEFEEN